MARIQTWFNQDLKEAVKVRYIDGNVFSADNYGNVIGVNVFDGGSPATLAGTVSANIIRADGATVAAGGTLSGNQVSVALPQAAYAVPGVLSVIVKVTDGTDITTVLAVVGNVYKATTDTVVDPGTIIPDISTLVAEIEAAIASIPADYSSLWASLAPNFSASKAYSIGDYVTYDGGLYQFIAAHSAGTWDSSEVVAVDLARGVYGGIIADRDGNLEALANYTGKYINNNGNIGTNSHLRCSDYVLIPTNATGIEQFCLYGSSAISPLCAFYDSSKTFISVMIPEGHTDGYKTFSIPAGAKYVRFNMSVVATTANVGKWLFRFIMLDTMKSLYCIGSETLTATSSNKTSAPGKILLKAGTTYKLAAKVTLPSTYYRFFLYNIESGQVVTTYFADIVPYNNGITIRPSYDSYLVTYNTETLDSISVTVNIYEYRNYPLTQTVREYYVSKNATYYDRASYQSLTQCLLDLANDENEKIIYVEAGDYDIYQEYVDAGVNMNPPSGTSTSNYFEYNVWVPKNTHIIGRGIVKLIWNPPTESISLLESKMVSTLNVAATATIENIEVHCTNGRYCLHNDSLTKVQFIGAIQRFINCRFYKHTNDHYDSEDDYGFVQTTGFGISARMQHIYEGCEFVNDMSSPAFYGHTRPTVVNDNEGTHTIWNLAERDSPRIIIKNCIFRTPGTQTMRLDNTDNDNLHVRMDIDSSYMQSAIRVNELEHQNAYDITLLNCNNPSVVGINTRYPARYFPPVG